MNANYSYLTNVSVTQRSMNDLTDFVSTATRLQIEYIIDNFFAPTIFLLGFSGNVMSLVVLIVQGTKEVTNIILIGLAVDDLVYIIMWFLARASVLIRYIHPVLAANFDAVVNAQTYAPRYALGRISACYTALVAVERYIVVLHPLKAGAIITRRRVIFVCIFIYVFVLVCAIGLFFVYDVRSKYSQEHNAEVWSLVNTKFMLDNYSPIQTYISYALPLLLCLMPVLTVTFCTYSIIWALSRSYIQREKMTGGVEGKGHAKRQKITNTLVCICILYLTCCTPNSVLQVTKMILNNLPNYDPNKYKNTMSLCSTFIRCLSATCTSANFYLYIATSRKFARTFQRIFLCGGRAPSAQEKRTLVSQTTENSEI